MKDGGKIVSLVAGICLCFTGAASLLSPDTSEILATIGVPLITFGIFLIVYSWDGKHGNCEKNIDSDEGVKNVWADRESAAVFRWRGLNDFGADLLRVYFDERGFSRLILYRRADGCVSFRKEKLYTADDAYHDGSSQPDYYWLSTGENVFCTFTIRRNAL